MFSSATFRVSELQSCSTVLRHLTLSRQRADDNFIFTVLFGFASKSGPDWHLAVTIFTMFYFHSKTQLKIFPVSMDVLFCTTIRRSDHVSQSAEGQQRICLPWKTGGVRFRFTSYERLGFGRSHSVSTVVRLLGQSGWGGMRVPERLQWLLRVQMANRFLFPGFVFVLG